MSLWNFFISHAIPFQNRLHLCDRNGNPGFRKNVLDILQAVSLLDSLADVVREELRYLRARLADLTGRPASKCLLCREDVFV